MFIKVKKKFQALTVNFGFITKQSSLFYYQTPAESSPGPPPYFISQDLWFVRSVESNIVRKDFLLAGYKIAFDCL